MILTTRRRHQIGRFDERAGYAPTTLLVVVLALVAGCGTDTETTPQTTSTTIHPTTTSDANSVVLVIGDWGAGNDAQVAVASAMEDLNETVNVEAILTTGDNFYTDDEATLMEPFQWATDEEIPFWISWGNHDVESAERVSDINAVFGSPPRWTVHEWHGIDVIILDSNQVGNEDQIDFLKDHVAASSNPAIIVFHHPALSCSRHGATASVLDLWVPLFDDDVFLVLAGHDHNYQRFTDNEITYVVSGGGGRRLYDLEECPEDHPPRIAGEASHHFLSLELGTEQVVVTAYRSDLSVIETVELDLPWSVGPEPSNQGDQTPIPMVAPAW